MDHGPSASLLATVVVVSGVEAVQVPPAFTKLLRTSSTELEEDPQDASKAREIVAQISKRLLNLCSSIFK